MGATEGRSQMCHWSKVMKRLLAPCSHPYLLVSEGLFEKQDKYSPSPWQIFFILVTIVTFIAPRSAADALRRRGIALHRRERGLCELKSKVFCRNCRNLRLPHWASTGFGVSFNSSSAGSPLLLVCMFYGSHLSFQLSGVRRGGWGIRWQHYYICQFQSFYTGFLTVNFSICCHKKKITVLWSQTYSGLVLKLRSTITPLFYRRWLILADLFESENYNA